MKAKGSKSKIAAIAKTKPAKKMPMAKAAQGAMQALQQAPPQSLGQAFGP